MGEPAAEIGGINADGNGHITGGVFDANDNGTLALNQAITGGSYAVASNGRGTATALSARGISSYAFYLVSEFTAVFVETDSFGVTEGIADLQQRGAAVSGSLGFASFGGGNSGGFESVGRITANDSGILTAGVEDVAQAGTVMSGVTLSGTYQSDSNGRGPAQLIGSGGTSNFIFYYVSQTEFKYLAVDPSAVIAGFFMLQSTIGYWDY